MRKIANLLLLLFVLLCCSCNKNPQPQSTLNLAQYLKSVQIADSLIGSKPDSALAVYKGVIQQVSQLGENKESKYLLGLSYLGIAYYYSNKGDFPTSLKNDSAAFNIGNQINDLTIKARALSGIGFNAMNTGDNRKASDNYEAALRVATEANDIETQAKIETDRAVLFAYQGQNQKCIDGFTSVLNIGKRTDNKKLMAASYLNLSVIYNTIGKNDSVLAYNLKALEIYKQLNALNDIMLCYQNIGGLYYDRTNFAKAIEYFSLTCDLALQLKNEPELARGYHNLAQVYIHIGDATKATEYQYKSLKIREYLGNKLDLARDYMAAGQLFFTNNDFAQSLSYYRKGQKLFLELDYPDDLGTIYGEMANAYSELKQKDSALIYFSKALNLYGSTQNRSAMAHQYLNLGNEYVKNGDYQKAGDYLLKSLAIKKETADEEGTAEANNFLADLYLTQSKSANPSEKKGYLKKAESTAQEAYQIATKIKTLPIIIRALKNLSMICHEMENFKDAYTYAVMTNTLSDTLLTKDKVQALIFAEARWNVEKKQKEVDNLTATQKLQSEIIRVKESEIKKQHLITGITILLLLLSVASAVIVILYIRKRKDAIHQKQLANITALRMQNARNTMSPHFFLNVLATLGGLAGQPERLAEKLKSLALLLRKMIENIDHTTISLEEELTSVRAYIDLYSDRIPEPFSVQYLVPENINLQRLVPAMLIQIPVENAIKHGLMSLEGEKVLVIQVEEIEDSLNISILDNGVGLKASAGRTTGTGTGLKVLLQTIRFFNLINKEEISFNVAERDMEGTDSKGTIVNIKIPTEFIYPK